MQADESLDVAKNTQDIVEVDVLLFAAATAS